MEFLLTTDNLTKIYRQTAAVKGVNMHIPKGSIYGFVGRNGSGKTTVIRLISGLIRPTSGSFALYGESSGAKLCAARRRMAAVVETPSMDMSMSAKDNLIMQCKILGIDESGIVDVLNLVRLDINEKKVAKNFSLGMKQRLGIAIALIGNPDFLILDEPINGLDPQGIVEIRELLIRLNQERAITILISSHILSELGRLATHYGFIDSGELKKEISAKELDGTSKKSIRLIVSSTAKLPQAISTLQSITNYTVYSETAAELFGSVNTTVLIMALQKEGIIVEQIKEAEENLESYYMNLLGGNNHA